MENRGFTFHRIPFWLRLKAALGDVMFFKLINFITARSATFHSMFDVGRSMLDVRVCKFFALCIFFCLSFLIVFPSLARNQWLVGEPILSQGPAGSFDSTSVKDPSIVYYKGDWHLFYTAAGNGEYTTGYVSAPSLEGLKNAQRHELKMIRGKKRYGCAPQVFYFSPQKKWYLLFQNLDANYQPVFSTTENMEDPQSWSKPQPLLIKDAKAKWIDFWVLCDKGRAYLYYTEGHNGVIVRSTSLNNFPVGWNKGKTVFTNIHEAVHVYKVEGKPEFHMFYELNHKNVRSFGMAKASHPEGPWTKVSDEYATGEQLKSKGKPWTEMVSHGEILRSGFDEKLEYNPEKCRWLIQGIMKKDKDITYPLLPWKLGVISLLNVGR